MARTDSPRRSVKPAVVLQEIAEVMPQACRKNMIIIGSLAVGYHYFAEQEEMVVRTKDADCLLSPRVQAVPAGKRITERLLDAGWQLDQEGQWTEPGTEDTPDDQLPAVRLRPPGESEWFLELLTVPRSSSDRARRWLRLETRYGHFGIPSFGFLSLTNLDPIPTPWDIAIARPQMMALANLLEHPEIGPATMTGGFAGRPDIKRSNKDLGRVLAIARLTLEGDTEGLEAWPGEWIAALQERFPDEWPELAQRGGKGLRSLLDSEPDLEQALHTCVNGVLNARPPTLEQLRLAGERLMQDAVEPLRAEAG